jgi:hypothetical protein
MERLAADLVADAPAGLTKAWFTCAARLKAQRLIAERLQEFGDARLPEMRSACE